MGRCAALRLAPHSLNVSFNMLRNSDITKEDVVGRSRVNKLAATDTELAAKTAHSIKHPWYRCQSLSMVAEHINGKRKEKLLLEALEVAKEQSDINRIVTVSAWPMRHLVEVSPDIAKHHIEALVELANREPHTLRRAHALSSLALSVSKSKDHLKLIVPSLVKALLNGHGWRIERIIRSSIPLVQAVQPISIDALLNHHSDNRKKRQLYNELQSNKI